MYRPRILGGLAVHHVKYKALAILIRTFLESAVIDHFVRNHYHCALFRWNVLEETDISKPISSPFYSLEFFATIKRVLETNGRNIHVMSTKDWYLELLNNNVLYDQSEGNGNIQRLVKCESLHPVAN